MNRLRYSLSVDPKKIFPFVVFFLLFAQVSLFGLTNLSRTAGDSLWPAIAVNSAGEIMVVWTEWSSGQNYYSINRNGTWTAPKICGVTSQQAWTNELHVDSSGMFHLSFADGWASVTRDIIYSYFNGTNWSNPELTLRSYWNSAWNKMDIDADNSIRIAWHHCYVGKDAPPESDIISMAKPKMGSWPSTYENVSRHRIGPSICPAIAVKDGNVYVVWMEGENPRRTYFCEKVGGVWKTPIELVGMQCYYLEMDVDNSGNLHICSGSKLGNFYYISRVGGKWTPVQVISNGNAPRQHGDIKCKNNVVVAVWTQGPDGLWDVYATGKMLGDNWALPVKIADAHGGEYGNKHVRVALDNKNTAHFVWHSIGVGGTYDIFYEKYSVDTPQDATFIEVDKSHLSFQTDDNSSNPAAQTFQVRASGVGSINYALTKDRSWLNVSPLQGSSSGAWVSHTVSVNAAGMSDGTYFGTIKITDPNAYNNPVEVGVSLTVGEVTNPPPPSPTPSSIQVDTANIEFTMVEGTNPQAQVINLRSSAGTSLGYTIESNKTWLTTSPRSGTLGSAWTPVSVSVDGRGKLPGTFNGRLDILPSGDSGGKVSVYVTLVVEKKDVPYIQVDKSHLYFWGYAHGETQPPKTFRIRNSGSKTLNYKITPNKGWILVSPAQGTSTGEWDTVSIRADSTNLEANKHKGNIRITAVGSENSPQVINIDFEVVHPPQPYAPLDVQVRRLNHEGLIIQEYKSEVKWRANPRNDGLFDIVKYRIFRRNQQVANSPYIYIGEVAANVFAYFDSGFSSKQERNNYIYSVAGVDSSGKEGIRSEFLGIDYLAESSLSVNQTERRKRTTEIKKVP